MDRRERAKLRSLMHRVFILSPARTTGKRAELLFNEQASFNLAARLREPPGATLGEVFAFLSGLYFRGKLAYAQRFAHPPEGVPGCYVITSDMGITTCDSPVTLARLKRFAATSIDPMDPNYRKPLVETAAEIKRILPSNSQIVLLGSIATDKYVGILHEAFGDQLLFPSDFIGRGDMSRGGLLLRCVEAGTELEYVGLAAVASRTGVRPPKLTPIKRRRPPRRTGE